jgi:hypothetical protein
MKMDKTIKIFQQIKIPSLVISELSGVSVKRAHTHPYLLQKITNFLKTYQSKFILLYLNINVVEINYQDATIPFQEGDAKLLNFCSNIGAQKYVLITFDKLLQEKASSTNLVCPGLCQQAIIRDFLLYYENEVKLEYLPKK